MPRRDGANGDGDGGRDGDGVLVEKCKEEVWETSEDNGRCGEEEEEQRERPKSLVSSSSVRTAGPLQTREKVGLTLAALLVI